MSHHDVLDAKHRNVNVILCNHTNTERGYLKDFKKILASSFDKSLQIDISANDAEPLCSK